ncbi:flavodoxin family protein [Nocardia carnea]|uniref:Flavodoxin family protein n=1 Tax=Nocardia carnea TaxID=37328 RepID=A0ABW7TX26_9NOCA
MRARVVYESVFGNTEAAATAIARGLQEHAEVDVVDVADATPDSHSPVDLLVVGGPTHAFGMSRRQTRQDAADRIGARSGRTRAQQASASGSRTNTRQPPVPGPRPSRRNYSARAGCPGPQPGGSADNYGGQVSCSCVVRSTSMLSV